MIRKYIRIAFIFGVVCASIGYAFANPPYVSASGDYLLKDGVRYRAIGVNYYDAFYRTLFNANDRSYVEGFNYLASNKIPFARVMFTGFWPSDLKLYQSNKVEYFSRLDRVVKAAENAGVGLIASINWNPSTIPDLVDEPRNAWGKKDSKTIQFMSKYTKEVVSRYVNSPAIWAWEFGNEYTLYVDLPNAPNFRPQVVPEKGTRLLRGSEDDLRASDVINAYQMFAESVRSIDKIRMLSTGNSLPRPFAYHNSRYNTWDRDSESEFCEILKRDNPLPFALMSVHIYPTDKNKYFLNGGASLNNIVSVAEWCSFNEKKVLFVGEFGVDKTLLESTAKQYYIDLIDSIVNNNVSLAALWVFDFKYQDGGANVSATNNRSYVIDLIKNANARLSSGAPN